MYDRSTERSTKYCVYVECVSVRVPFERDIQFYTGYPKESAADASLGEIQFSYYINNRQPNGSLSNVLSRLFSDVSSLRD